MQLDRATGWFHGIGITHCPSPNFNA
ncbi:MAG: 1,6-anhydro-N-acetylmuramyl-L-alanine amidase AmpD, partial [Pseudomonas alloputida]